MSDRSRFERRGGGNRVMRFGSIALSLLLAVPRLALAADIGIIKPIRVVEFLKLPEQIQSVYVGGLIEGMSFVSYGYSLPQHGEWVACVRSKTLGDTTKEVVAFLQHKLGWTSTGSALAHVIGQRCKH